jgi:predicted nucleic acid-binding protein
VIFIDTGPFLARYVERDQCHAKAVEDWRRLAGQRARCYTSNFVLDEMFTLLARRAGYRFAAERARAILSSPTLVILRPTHEDETRAVELLAKYADQEVSFTDCVSFALMRKNKIKRAFAFDADFEILGFEFWPGE